MYIVAWLYYVGMILCGAVLYVAVILRHTEALHLHGNISNAALQGGRLSTGRHLLSQGDGYNCTRPLYPPMSFNSSCDYAKAACKTATASLVNYLTITLCMFQYRAQVFYLPVPKLKSY